MGPIERLRRIGAVRRHLEQRREALYRLAFAWCNDPCLADDLVQQAAAKALQGAGQLRGVERVGAHHGELLAGPSAAGGARGARGYPSARPRRAGDPGMGVRA